MRPAVHDLLIRIALVTAGSLLAAAGIQLFLVPIHLLTAGVAGIALLVSYLTPLPSAAVLVALNIPIFLGTRRLLEREFLLWSLLGMAGLSLALAVTQPLATLHPVKDFYLNLLAGSVVAGLGTGLVFRARASQGGTDVIAAAIRKVSSVRIGPLFFVLNASGVLGLAWFYGLEPALATAVAILVESVVVEQTIVGVGANKAMLTITNRPREVADALMNGLDRGATFLQGEGAYTGNQTKVVLCILRTRQLAVARKIVKDQDPNAFTFVQDVTEVIGHGFERPPI
jgi:uncharacterized membrane-anchored protein YitT (DUF2179 family)